MTAWRHDFHRHPELGFQEEKQQGLLPLLKSLGLEVLKKLGTGVVGVLQRQWHLQCCFRSDMDALPLGETGEVP